MAEKLLTPHPNDPRDSRDSPETNQPNTVGTPEGDNEYTPDEPLTPAPAGEQRVPAIDTNRI